jgi:hypothetical protein
MIEVPPCLIHAETMTKSKAISIFFLARPTKINNRKKDIPDLPYKGLKWTLRGIKDRGEVVEGTRRSFGLSC